MIKGFMGGSHNIISGLLFWVVCRASTYLIGAQGKKRKKDSESWGGQNGGGGGAIILTIWDTEQHTFTDTQCDRRRKGGGGRSAKRISTRP